MTDLSSLRIIALETSGPVGSVCLAVGERVLDERRFERGMEHGRMLVAVLDELCREAGWDPRRDIQLAAVSQGPGSFTGLRVGIAAVKTIASLTGCAVAGVSSLEVLANGAPAEERRVCAAVDAKRGQVYGALFEREDRELRRRTDDLLITPRSLLDRIGPPALVIGDGLRGYPEAFRREGFRAAPSSSWAASASVVARLGLRLYAAGHTIPWRDLAPIYHRLPEAEEKRLRREGKL